MKIPKSNIVFFGFMFLGLVTGFLLYFLFRDITPLSCNTFKKLYPLRFDCGIVVSDQQSEFHQIVGRVQSVVKQNDAYFLLLRTKDSHGSAFTQKFLLPGDPFKLGLVTFYSGRDMTQGKNTISEMKGVKASSLLTELQNNQEIIVQVLTPGEKEIKEAVARLGRNKYTKCLPYNRDFIAYMKNSSLINSMRWKYDEYVHFCTVSSLVITVPK